MSTDTRSVVVIGGGGHAKVVIAALEACGHRIGAVFDDDPGAWGRRVGGHLVVGAADAAAMANWRLGVIAVGSNAARRQLAERLTLEWVTVVHPTAWVHRSVPLGPGAVVFAGAVVQPDAVIGAHVIVNTGATVDHDCRIDEYAHVCPGAHLAGDVSVRAGAMLGVGASVTPGRTVGEWAVVGAGAVVIADIEPGVTAVGVPARPLGSRRRSTGAL